MVGRLSKSTLKKRDLRALFSSKMLPPHPRHCSFPPHLSSSSSTSFSSSLFLPFSFLCSSTTLSTSPCFSSLPNHQYALAYCVSVHWYRSARTIPIDCQNGSDTRKGKPCYKLNNNILLNLKH